MGTNVWRQTKSKNENEYNVYFSPNSMKAPKVVWVSHWSKICAEQKFGLITIGILPVVTYVCNVIYSLFLIIIWLSIFITHCLVYEYVELRIFEFLLLILMDKKGQYLWWSFFQNKDNESFLGVILTTPSQTQATCFCYNLRGFDNYNFIHGVWPALKIDPNRLWSLRKLQKLWKLFCLEEGTKGCLSCSQSSPVLWCKLLCNGQNLLSFKQSQWFYPPVSLGFWWFRFIGPIKVSAMTGIAFEMSKVYGDKVKFERCLCVLIVGF